MEDGTRLGSLLGYAVGTMMRDMFNKAGSTETEALIKALEGAKFDSLFGAVTMRAIDHQATVGAWVGETTLNGKNGTMKNWRYVDGADYVFPEADVRAVRKN